jgi:hypothetical protein
MGFAAVECIYYLTPFIPLLFRREIRKAELLIRFLPWSINEIRVPSGRLCSIKGRTFSKTFSFTNCIGGIPMNEITRTKRLEVAHYYLLGFTYREIEEAQKEREIKGSEKRTAEEIEQLAREQARREACLAREKATAEAQEAKKLKAQRQPPERAE